MERVKRTKELSASALDNALGGYDVIHGEPYNAQDGTQVDPGLKSTIFKRGEKVEIRKVTNCVMSTRSKVVTTLNQFRKVTGTSSIEGSSLGFERKGSVTAGDPSGTVSATADVEVC